MTTVSSELVLTACGVSPAEEGCKHDFVAHIVPAKCMLIYILWGCGPLILLPAQFRVLGSMF